MKTCPAPSRLLAVAALSLACCALPSLRAAEETLIDFAHYPRESADQEIRPYEYAWGDWNNHVNNLRGKGTVIQGRSGKGGIGENRTGVDFAGSRVLELRYVVGNGNRAGTFSFYLEDKDGTKVAWNLSLADKPVGRELRQRIDLGKPDYTESAGKTPGLNLKKI